MSLKPFSKTSPVVDCKSTTMLALTTPQGSGSCSLGSPEQLTRSPKQYWTVQDLHASDLKPFHVHVNLQLSLAQVPMLPTHAEQVLLKPLAWIWLLMQDWARPMQPMTMFVTSSERVLRCLR